MPIEIRELVIKAVVDESGQSAGEERGTGRSESNTDRSLEDTVQKVLELLQENRNER